VCRLASLSTAKLQWWPRSPARAWTRPRPPRSRCWRWSPGRTSSRPRAPTAATAGGGSPGPAGITRRITRTRAVTFGAACRGCPLRRQCTTARDGRALTLHEHDALLRAARAEWPAIRDDYRARRPNVERAVAQVATQRGRRLKLRYRGVTPNDAWLRTRTAALNLRNLIGRGLTRHDGTWLLAT
jgi:Transposase DDE domain